MANKMILIELQGDVFAARDVIGIRRCQLTNMVILYLRDTERQLHYPFTSKQDSIDAFMIAVNQLKQAPE